MWESEGEAWYEDESMSSSGSREDNVCNDALHVIGLYGLVARSLLEGLGACEGGVKLSHCPGCAVPGNARGPVVGLLLPEEPPVSQKEEGT